MFNSLHSHVLRHYQAHLETFFSNSDVAWRTFLFSSIEALRISSRLSPWRSQSFYFAGEARTVSVRRSNATFRKVREARRNAQPIGASRPFQNGGDNIELRQQFQQLQQKVQDLLNRSSYDERMLFVNQLTQLSPWFKQPSTRRSNRQQPQLPKLQ